MEIVTDQTAHKEQIKYVVVYLSSIYTDELTSCHDNNKVTHNMSKHVNTQEQKLHIVQSLNMLDTTYLRKSFCVTNLSPCSQCRELESGR